MSKMRSFAVCALVLAAGCGSKASDSGGSAGDPSSCTGAIDQGMQSMMDARKKALEERMGSAVNGADREAKILERSQGVLDKLKVVLNTRCAEDKWTPEALACFSKVAKREDVQACISKLPKDQADRTSAEMVKAMTAGMGGMRMRPPSNGGPIAPPGTAPLPGAAPVPEPGAPVAPAPATPTPAAPAAPAPAAPAK